MYVDENFNAIKISIKQSFDVRGTNHQRRAKKKAGEADYMEIDNGHMKVFFKLLIY